MTDQEKEFKRILKERPACQTYPDENSSEIWYKQRNVIESMQAAFEMGRQEPKKWSM